MPEVEQTVEDVVQEDLEEVVPETEEDKPEADIIDIIQPKAEARTWVLQFEGEEREYVQKPLSYFDKMRFFSLVGETLDLAMQTGLDVSGLLGSNTRRGLTSAAFSDINSFVMAFSKLARYAPDLFKESYCIWLSVPYEDTEWAKLAMDDLTDEEGIEIIEIFLDQNFEAVRNFFIEWKTKVIDRAVKLNKEASPQSKLLKPTRRRTRKKSKTS